MADILVPTLGESVSEATIAQWLKQPGEAVGLDEPIIELETDKVTLEVNAPAAGVLSEVIAQEGDNVEVGALLGRITEGATASAPAAAAAAPAPAAAPAAPVAPVPAAPATPTPAAPAAASAGQTGSKHPLSPAVRKMVEENHLDASQIPGTGKDGRLTKGDVLDYLQKGGGVGAKPAKVSSTPQATAPKELPPRPEDPREERVRMTKLRRTIANRLKDAQNTAAMLTTFNEVDMTDLIKTRAKYKDRFEKKHGVRLGFLSFFAKACVQALQELPAVNAEIYGDEIIYKNYYDVAIAVGTPQGLVVPVVRNVDQLAFHEVEQTVAELAKRARDGKLSMAEMTGGSFTITNGGVYGSLLSTPILNPPQAGILGMHKTMKRPMVVGDRIEPRDMMYLALSYDHRIIDGKEAVTFLVRVKEMLEDPERLLLQV